jgi:hypothetical protein
MTPAARSGPTGGRGMDAISVRVEHSQRGGWEIALPGQSSRLRCATLQQARDAASAYAARAGACELVVHDAYIV